MHNEHNYSHSHSVSLNLEASKAFKTGILLNITFVVIEALSGYFFNSMALIADAGHNLSDVLTLVFSWIAVYLANRKPTQKFTYGFQRSTILIAILNTIILLVAISFITYETVGRIGKPQEINSKYVVLIALIGIVINGLTAWLFSKNRKHDLNIRSSFIHFFADALVSLGVVIAGIMISVTGLAWIDTLVSFAIIVVVLYSTYKLLIDSINLALDAVPENINIQEVRNFLENLPEVSNVHDLHIWALSTTDAALTAHLTTREQTDVSFITSIQQQIDRNFGISHTTIQVEFGGQSDECDQNYHD
jgi:cobalt-zinc-cadmium efflux system protein